MPDGMGLAWFSHRSRSEKGKRFASVLFKLAGDQFLDRGERGVGVHAFGADGDDGAVACRQHHQSHDALAIHFFAVFFHEDIRLEPIRGFDELRGGTSVNAEFVEDGELFFCHGKWALAAAH